MIGESRIQGVFENVLTSLSCQGISSNPKKISRRQSCDRNNPCAACVAGSIECRPGTFMVSIGATKRSKQCDVLQVETFRTTTTTGYFLCSTPVIQNADGTWGFISQSLLRHQAMKKRKIDEPPLTPPRPRGRRRIAATQSFQDPVPTSEIQDYHIQVSSRDLSADKGAETLPKLRGQKRKALDDDDFVPSPKVARPEQKESNALTSSIVVAKKRKSAGNTKGGYVKYHQSVQDDKKAPFGEPPVWADKRQSLCETLPYYKAYQSGAYITQGTVRAFMCDKEVGPRDKFTEEIMITRV